MTIAVQINGKTRGAIELDSSLSQQNIVKSILQNDGFKKYLNNLSVIKEIYVPNRLVNFVIKK